VSLLKFVPPTKSLNYYSKSVFCGKFGALPPVALVFLASSIRIIAFSASVFVLSYLVSKVLFLSFYALIIYFAKASYSYGFLHAFIAFIYC
jgi:hypothetical protein